MKRIKMFFGATLVASLFLAGSAVAQDQALQKLIHGKKFFWEAKFNQALTSLKQVTEIKDAKREYLFEAYLYTGFVLLRQKAPGSEVESVFSQAIRLEPRRKLDEMVIPPDLIEPFYDARNKLVGCLYIVTEPEEVDIIGVKGDSVLFDETTPLQVCDLVDNDYQLLLSEEGYDQQFIPLKLNPGKTDTLHIALDRIYAQGGGKTGLKWALRGGILVAAGAVLYKTVIAGGDDAVEDLPGPPARPDR